LNYFFDETYDGSMLPPFRPPPWSSATAVRSVKGAAATHRQQRFVLDRGLIAMVRSRHSKGKNGDKRRDVGNP
jgi:hypothetical protein